MKILVTGGAGFIGSHVADAYRRRGPRGGDPRRPLERQAREPEPEGRVSPLDVQSPEVAKLIRRVERAEVLNHHAAQMDVRKLGGRPGVRRARQPRRLAQSARERAAPRARRGSSSPPRAEPSTASRRPSRRRRIDPTRPVSPYGVSKRASERYLYFYEVQYGLPYVALRYGNVYGPRQNPHGEAGVVAIFTEKLLRGERRSSTATASRRRDYVFIADIVRANVAARRRPTAARSTSAPGARRTSNQIFRRRAPELRQQRRPSNTARRSRASSGAASSIPKRAGEMLGWKPRRRSWRTASTRQSPSSARRRDGR